MGNNVYFQRFYYISKFSCIIQDANIFIKIYIFGFFRDQNRIIIMLVYRDIEACLYKFKLDEAWRE